LDYIVQNYSPAASAAGLKIRRTRVDSLTR